MQDFYVYILRCSDGTYYTGHTSDLDCRMGHHVAGTASDYTARRRPARLVWTAAFPTRDQAFCFERQLKGWSRAKKEAVIRGDWETLPGLACAKSATTRETVVPAPQPR